MSHPILLIFMRYLHIVSAVSIVGGLICVIVCLRPALAPLEEAVRKATLDAALRRFERIVHLGVLGLLVSGTFNWIMLAKTYSAMGPVGNALIGTKTLLAVIIFVVVFARASNLLKPGRFWQMFNLHLAAIVILLGSILYILRVAHLVRAAAGA